MKGAKKVARENSNPALLAAARIPKARGKYAPVNGLRLYYEIHGKSKGKSLPLLILHGGVGGHEMFGPNLPLLAKSRTVIAVHLQGHGRTADIDRPLRFEFMADDIAQLLKYIGLEKADVLGCSLGGGVAVQTAIRHPDVVRRLVAVSQPFRRNGWYPEVLVGMSQLGPGVAEMMKHSPLSRLYPNVNWATLFTKLPELLNQDFDWSKDVAAIKAPTMLVYADADAIQPAHIMEFFGLLGGGKRDAGLDGRGRPVARLAVLPDLNHYTIIASPAVTEAVTPFLDAALPETR